MNAISLQSTVFNGAAVVGPALAGITIGLLTNAGHLLGQTGSLTGYAGSFFLNGISYFGVLFVLYFIHVPREAIEQSTEKRGPMLDSIRVALRAVGSDPVLPWVLSGYGALLFFGPSNTLILPIFATQILHLDAFQLGLLFSAAGLGTLIGALTVASLGDFKYKGWLLLASLFLWTISLIIFAFSRLFWLSLLALLLFGIAQNGVGATVITLAQLRVAPQMRGRVMSLNTLLIMGVRPLGDFPASVMIVLMGGPLTIFVCALIVGGYSLFLLIEKPLIRSL
jgi:predicted MFS family arabinose efflux permease